jgi:hypothetical protein
MIPGAYGLGRSWDLTVLKDGVPLGAITLTSHTAPINNFNNRVRELTSTAFDVRRQYASSELRDLRPCLGFFFILIRTDNQHPGVSASRPSSTNPNIGDGLAFQERYGKVFRQFRADGLYDSVAYCAVTGEGADASAAEPLPDLAIDGFLAHFVERVLSLASAMESAAVTRRRSAHRARDAGVLFKRGPQRLVLERECMDVLGEGADVLDSLCRCVSAREICPRNPPGCWDTSQIFTWTARPAPETGSPRCSNGWRS